MTRTLSPQLLLGCTLAFAACSPGSTASTASTAPTADPIAWSNFPDVSPAVAFETRFRNQEPFSPSTAEAQFLQEHCPILKRAHAIKDSETFWLMTLEGERLSDSTRVGALLPDGTLADARPHASGGSLQIPVACESCTLVMGVALPSGKHAACTGPGYSLTFETGRITSP